MLRLEIIWQYFTRLKGATLKQNPSLEQTLEVLERKLGADIESLNGSKSSDSKQHPQ
ncbi:MAG: hypothetical protein ACHBN1_00250 [Heteroscytonema crispum UTEX LB 1556]